MVSNTPASRWDLLVTSAVVPLVLRMASSRSRMYFISS